MLQHNSKISLWSAWAIVLLLTAATLAPAQETATPTVVATDSTTVSAATPGQPGQAQTPPAASGSGIGRNFKQWTSQGGWVMYPIYVDFILGLGIIIYQVVKVQFDKYRSKPVLKALQRKLAEQTDEKDHKAKVQEIFDLVSQHSKSLMARLFAKLCGLWQRDPSADSLQVEIKGEIEGAREGYDLARNFAVLLSDTAGALGLLGTVLGMYVTFMPGRLEASQVIYGMGVALVTTIGGLIVSIVLNFAISFAQSRYLTHLSSVTELADQFRYVFGTGQSVSVVATAPAISQSISAQPISVPAPEPKMAPPRRIPSRIRILGGDNQIGEAGAALAKALEVAVEDQNGRPMENLPVVFDTNGTLITFDNGANIKQIETDTIGRARVQARLGKMIGQHTVTARVNGEANLVEEFRIECRPGAPDKLYVLSGHLETTSPGALLSEPLSLKLEDASGNPVPDHPVVFEVAYNGGRLDRDKSRLEVRTDEGGVATVGFRLSDTAGANIVKAQVKGKTNRKLEASFESMGRE